MKELLAIFIGGGLGSLARYGFSKWLGVLANGFPIGTLVANLAACLVIGMVAGIFYQKTDVNPVLKGLIITGFCGGFSTFSTFSFETFSLFGENKPLIAVAYVVGSVLLCLAGVAAGYWVGKMV